MWRFIHFNCFLGTFESRVAATLPIETEVVLYYDERHSNGNISVGYDSVTLSLLSKQMVPLLSGAAAILKANARDHLSAPTLSSAAI